MPAVIGSVIAVAVAIALTIWAHALVCMGMHPEAASAAELAAPLLGLACGAAWAGRRARRAPWLAGLIVGIILVVLWLAGWCFLMGRASPRLWWQQAIPGVTSRHLVAWAWALAAGLCGGVIGGWLRPRRARAWLVLAALALLTLTVIMQATAAGQRAAESPLGRERELTAGMTVTCEPTERDGTIVRLLSFDFEREPRLSVGLYDADSDDASPRDDSNTTWPAQSLHLVLDKLEMRARARGREVLCLFNAGFFNMGLGRLFVGGHVAPVVVDGTPLYNVRPAVPGEWVFGISRQQGRPRFHLAEAIPWERLARFDTAVGHVRPLRVAGKSPPLDPGPGVTRLKCSRTSLGWTPDWRRLFVLIVRDPDGEIPGIRQMKSGRTQTGGWDLAQLQQFWERMGVEDAILLDGGDSSKLAYRRGADDYVSVTSGYLLSRTLGYWRGRPLRFFVPTLPAAQSHAGVMNYLYVEGPPLVSMPKRTGSSPD